MSVVRNRSDSSIKDSLTSGARFIARPTISRPIKLTAGPSGYRADVRDRVARETNELVNASIAGSDPQRRFERKLAVNTLTLALESFWLGSQHLFSLASARL